jgi:alpha-1,6-mannosyltransferase
MGISAFTRFFIPKSDRTIQLFGLIAAFFSFLIYSYLFNFHHRDDFYIFIASIIILLPAQLYLIKSLKASGKWKIIGLFILLRLPVFTGFPVLSDDYFRFRWDAALLAQWEDPYAAKPESISATVHQQIDPDSTLLHGMNSAQYYSVYPPLQQFFFMPGMLGNTVYEAVFYYRLMFLFAEILCLLLFFRLINYYNEWKQKYLYYVFSPLVIIEGIGNLHFEIFVVLFMLMALYLFLKNKWLGSALMLGLSAGIKLIPLVYLPLSLRPLSRKSFRYAVIVIVVFILTFLPVYFTGNILNFKESLNLYSGSFEFNASLYYLIRYVWEMQVGYNPIQQLGPIMQALTFVVILTIALWKKKENIQDYLSSAVLILTVYLLFSTTVHPWYIIPLLALTVFTKFNFPLVWSFAIFLSYSHYQYGAFEENYLLIGLEYFTLVMTVYFERRKFREEAVRDHTAIA